MTPLTEAFQLNGRKYAVIDPAPAVSEEAIVRLEDKLGFRLPDQLRSYYKRWNGGLPFPLDLANADSACVRLFWKPGAPAADAGHIGCLCGLLEIDSNPSMDLLKTYGWFKDRIPPGLLPFMSDPGNSQYLIGTADYNLGRIYFWDRGYQANQERGEVPGYDNIADVAPSFADFLLAFRSSYQPPGESEEEWIRRNYPE